ncbi:MAG: tetratricopeptide repeat protein [Candidatus Lokiarchaeota archaeon]|nr:tetratricopeptide repeat protein [Candidatus Lokiarchaeota archaeon]
MNAGKWKKTTRHYKHRFVVNEHLDVVWDPKQERVQVLVDGQPVLHCAFLVGNISISDDEVSCIDDLAARKDVKRIKGSFVRNLLSIKEEVLAHASNIQAWAEHDYNTRILHSNIAFPLLKALAIAGDVKAGRIFEAEIVERLRDGTPATQKIIVESCEDHITTSLLRDLIEGCHDDKKVALLNRIGSFLGMKGEYSRAIQATRMAIAIKADDNSTWLQLAHLLQWNNDVTGAIDAYKKALEIKPDDAPAWLELSSFFRRLGDEDSTIDALMHSLSTMDVQSLADPIPRRFLKNYAEACHFTMAVDNILASNSKIAIAWVLKGDLLASNGNVDAAKQAFLTAIECNPQCAVAWYRLGRLHVRANDVKAAVVAYRQALRFQPGVAIVWITLGRQLQGIGDRAGAIEAFNKALSIQPTREQAWFKLGRLLEDAGDTKPAIAAYFKAAALAPYRDSTWKRIWALLFDGRISSCIVEAGVLSRVFEPGVVSVAIDACHKAMSSHFRRGSESLELGRLLLALGDKKGAIDAFRVVTEIDKKNEPAWIELGRLLDASGDVRGAIKAYEKALSIQPGDPVAWQRLGKARLRNNDHKGADGAFRKAKANSPGNNEARSDHRA